MSNLIKIKRGIQENLPILQRGEVAYTTDTKRLYIGVETEPTSVEQNVFINDLTDYFTKNQIEEIVDSLTQVIDLELVSETDADFNPALPTEIKNGQIYTFNFPESTATEDVRIVLGTENPFILKLGTEIVKGTFVSEKSFLVAVDTEEEEAFIIAGGVVTTLNDLEDISITSLANGNFLVSDGTEWINRAVDGEGLTFNTGTNKIDVENPFNPNGTFAGLRAQATTAADVGLDNVTNESKATMFTNPTFTGTVTLSSDPKLTGLPLPESDTEAASKLYVDQIAQGLKSRTAALVLVEDDLSGTYDSIPDLHEFESDTNGPFPTTDGIDTAVLNVEGTRIVLAGQSNPAHNGLYVLKQEGDSETPWILRRCTQCDTSAKIPGSFVFISQGTKFANTGWTFDVADPSTFEIGVDPINVIQFSGAGSFLAGNGLDLDGNTFEIDTNVVVDKTSNQTIGGEKTFTETITGAITSVEETNDNQIISFWTGTEQEYTAVDPKLSSTLYFIIED